jgi:hypothetical protein
MYFVPPHFKVVVTSVIWLPVFSLLCLGTHLFFLFPISAFFIIYIYSSFILTSL